MLITWNTITMLGAAEWLIPLTFLLTTALWLQGHRRLAWRWFCRISLGGSFVLLTKVAFMGWGLGIATWDYTGFSGHAAMAMSIYPVACAALILLLKPAPLDAPSPRNTWPLWCALAVGTAIGLLVAWSRWVVQAHSLSEIFLGTGLGLLVTLWTIPDLWCARHRLAYRSLALSIPVTGVAGMALLLLSIPKPQLPFLEQELALKLSGRAAPYTRHMLQARAPAPQSTP